MIEHEIADMWFGDLVTMGWWNGIWLNEAFATYMSLGCLDDFRPEYRRWMASGAKGLWRSDRRPPHDAGDRGPGAPPRRGRGACSTPSRTRRAAACCGCWSSISGRSASVTACAVTLPPIGTGTPRRQTSGMRSSRRPRGADPALMDSWILQGGFPLVTARRDGDEIELSNT